MQRKIVGRDGTHQLEINEQGEVTVSKIATPIVISGSRVEEVRTQDNAFENSIAFSDNIYGIEIYHGEATPQVFTVNGIAITVVSGGWRSPIGGVPSPYVQIPAGINCIVSRLI